MIIQEIGLIYKQSTDVALMGRDETSSKHIKSAFEPNSDMERNYVKETHNMGSEYLFHEISDE